MGGRSGVKQDGEFEDTGATCFYQPEIGTKSEKLYVLRLSGLDSMIALELCPLVQSEIVQSPH